MGNVIRNIGGVDLMINPNKANEVFFEEDFIIANKIESEDLSPNDLCKYIAGNRYLPLIATWELLDKCSFGCSFCYIVGHSKYKVVKFNEMKPNIEKLIDMGLLYCMLTGGEATMHPDFAKIYRFLKESGVIVEVYTNGSLIDDTILELFRELPPYRIEVSIYGVTQNNFELVAGTDKFRFETVLDNILKLKNDNHNLRCKTPLNSTTLEEFENIAGWCKTNEVEFYYATNIYEAYDGIQLDKFAVDIETAMKFEAKKILDIEQRFTGEIDIYSNPKGKTCYTCGIRNYGLHINSGFELMPCSETHFEQSKSSIRTVGIEKAIEKYRNFVSPFIGRDIIGCTGCEASNFCKMCSAKAEPVKDTFGNISDFKVPENHCENQRKKSRLIVQEIMNIA